MTLQLENYGVSELSHLEQEETDGGFIPLVILGVKISAEIVAGLFVAGVAVGATVASNQHVAKLSAKK